MDRDDLVRLEEACRMAAGELEDPGPLPPKLDEQAARKLIRRRWLADLLRGYAAKIRGHLAGNDTG